MVRAGLAILALALAVPAFGAPTVRQLVETIDMSGLAISPDGRWVAFRQEAPSIERNVVALDWYVVPLDGTAPPRRIASGGAPIHRDSGTLMEERPAWSPDSKRLFFRAAIDDQVQIWSASRDGASVRQESRSAADVEAFAVDGTGLVIEVGADRSAITEAERQEAEQGILLDATIDPGQALVLGGRINGRRATQRLSGDWFDRRGLLGAAPRRLFRIDFATHQEAAASAADARLLADTRAGDGVVNGAPATQATDPVSRRTATMRQGGVPQVSVTLPGKAGTPIACPAAACGTPVVWAKWLPGGQSLALAGFEPTKGWRLTRWQVETGQVHLVYAGEAMLSGDWSPVSPCAFTTAVAVCVVAGTTEPPRVEAFALRSPERRILAAPNAAMPRGEARRILWQDQAGTTFAGQYFPASMPNPPAQHKAPAPLFITYNSCNGFVRGGAGDEWPLAALAEHGIAALCIYNPVRQDPARYDALAAYRTALGGVRGAIDKLAAAGDIDRSRVGMGGLSFGTEVTAFVLTHSDLLAAASMASPLLEPTYYWFNVARNDNIRRNFKAWWGLGAPEETPERWHDVSAAARVDLIHAPILFQMPEQEYRYNLELISRLTAKRSPVETILYPDEAHVKAQPRHKLAVNQRNLDWFLFWLRGDRRDDAPSGQYERWATLRAAAPTPGS